MIENAIRAARLDVAFYNAAENDKALTGQAALLVAIVSLLGGIGTSFVVDHSFIKVMGYSLLTGLVGWVVWSFITDFVGRTVFKGESDPGQMLRVIGFAQAPLALSVIPVVGAFVGSIWALVAGVVAIREGQDFTTGKAIGTVIIGWIAYLVLRTVVFAIFR